MALTKISTDGVKDDAITKTKIPADQIETSEIASGAVTSTQIADNTIVDGDIADATITLAKLEHGTSSNDGKFLRANNGADPSFETVSIPAGTTITNNADNRVITGSDTANTVLAESNLSFSNNELTVHEASLKGNQLAFSPSGTAYIDHKTNGQDIQFRTSVSSTNDTVSVKITSVGNLAFASGKGIDFSATGSPTNGTDSSELLNDYEEGSWTPTVTFGGNSAGQSYSNQVGQYVKVGRLVHIQCYVAFTNIGSSTGTAKIAGLPYATKNVSDMFPSAAIAYFHNGNSSAGPGSTSTFMVYGEVNETNLNIQREEITDATPEMNDAHEYNFANNTEFMVTMTYVSN